MRFTYTQGGKEADNVLFYKPEPANETEPYQDPQLKLDVDLCQFNMNVTEKASGNVILSTKDQRFIMMKQYLEIGFRVRATRFFGLGERNGDFFLKPGNYTLLGSSDADFSYDLGQGKR